MICKSILISVTKDFDYRSFFSNNKEEEWDLYTLIDIKKTWRKIISKKYKKVALGHFDLNDKTFRYILKSLLVFIKAKEKYFIDNQGRKEKFSFLTFVFIDTPLFILEIIFDLLLVVFSWLALFVFNLLPKSKSLFCSPNGSLAMTEKEIIYLRTDNFRNLQEGGSFTHFRGVVGGLYKLGYKIHYIGSGIIETPNLNFTKDIISYPKKFNLPEIPEIYYNWRFIPKAYKVIKKGKPIFIYQRHSIFNVCGAILSQLTGVPLILEYNGSEPWVRQKWGGLLILKRLCYFMENFSLRKATIITVVSDVLKEELIKRKIPAKKILVSYNGVDPEEFNPNIDGSDIRKKYNLNGKIVIGAVSTFGVWHGMSILAKAIKPIIQKFQSQNSKFQIHFLFVGDGVERPKCENIIKEDKMEDYVTFTGLVSYKEIPKYLAACDIFVSPHIPNADGSEFFGSPTKIFEYMAMGKPIVASKLGQIREILKDKETAFLVEPGNIEELVKAISELVKDEKLRDNLGNKARLKAISEFSWSNNVQKLIQLFKEQ